MRTIVPRTFIVGRPAVYSTTGVNGWHTAVESALAGYRNVGLAHDSGTRYEIELYFVIDRLQYGRAEPFKTHGPDLDNLAKCTIEILAQDSKGRGLRVLQTDAAVHRLNTWKEVAADGQMTGVWVTVRLVETSDIPAPSVRGLPSKP